MEDVTVGWIAAIIIGGIAGWLAEQFVAQLERHATLGDRSGGAG
jgi:uncharacterized membrane protein YeaQ/YmgE (transglycosylase-associated protein family)